MNNFPLTILVKRFPKLSETFIQGEISSLIDKGFDVRIVSLHRPTEQVMHSRSNQLRDRVVYLDDYSTLGSVILLLARLFCRPKILFGRFSEIFSSLDNFLCIAKLFTDSKKNGTTHTHAHYISEPALLADLVAILTNGEFSISAHAKDIYLTDRVALRNRVAKAKFVVTCTAHNVEYLREVVGEYGNKVFLSYHGIDTAFFKPADALVIADSPLIVSVGRFKTKKGFDVLINSCSILKRQGRHFQCQIIGYGDQQAALSEMINDLDLEEDVFLVDPIPHDALISKLHHANLFVLPCRLDEDGDRDGIPNAMLEAMACGLPVISTKVSGIPEVIDSESNGLLVAPNDAESLALAMQRVLDDTNLRENLAQQGRQTVTEKFSWTSNIQTLADLLAPQYELIKTT